MESSHRPNEKCLNMHFLGLYSFVVGQAALEHFRFFFMIYNVEYITFSIGKASTLSILWQTILYHREDIVHSYFLTYKLYSD